MGKDKQKDAANDRAKLFKKAVLAGVGASTNVERVKAALSDAMEDLVRVGQDLLDELEDKGKGKTENFQSFLRNLQDEAGKRTQDAEKKITSKVQGPTKRAVKDLGLATQDEIAEILERLEAIEVHAFGESRAKKPVETEAEHEEDEENHDGDGSESEGKKRKSKKSNNNNG
ncbi:MAG TPA: phasin family protein [Drouetiella sp.]